MFPLKISLASDEKKEEFVKGIVNKYKIFRTSTVEHQYNESLYYEVLDITNDFLYRNNKYVMKPSYNMYRHILPVSWPFPISRFHY